MTAVNFAVLAALVAGFTVSVGMWASAATEVEVLQAHIDRQNSDVRHWKQRAYKCDDYVIQEVHAARLETLAIASQLETCKAGRP